MKLVTHIVDGKIITSDRMKNKEFKKFKKNLKKVKNIMIPYKNSAFFSYKNRAEFFEDLDVAKIKKNYTYGSEALRLLSYSEILKKAKNGKKCTKELLECKEMSEILDLLDKDIEDEEIQEQKYVNVNIQLNEYKFVSRMKQEDFESFKREIKDKQNILFPVEVNYERCQSFSFVTGEDLLKITEVSLSDEEICYDKIFYEEELISERPQDEKRFLTDLIEIENRFKRNKNQSYLEALMSLFFVEQFQENFKVVLPLNNNYVLNAVIKKEELKTFIESIKDKTEIHIPVDMEDDEVVFSEFETGLSLLENLQYCETNQEKCFTNIFKIDEEVETTTLTFVNNEKSTFLLLIAKIEENFKNKEKYNSYIFEILKEFGFLNKTKEEKVQTELNEKEKETLELLSEIIDLQQEKQVIEKEIESLLKEDPSCDKEKIIQAFFSKMISQ